MAAVLVGGVSRSGMAADTLSVTLRMRVEAADEPGRWVAVEKVEEWDPAKTAIVICDMWDKHWCPTATERVAEMAPVMNRMVKAARARGVLIVHSPSDTLDHYKGTPQRKLAQSAPKAANLPKGITNWCSLQKKEGRLPIDDSDEGCDCGKKVRSHRAWSKQIEAIEIADGDAISDKGDEVWNLFESRGIQNVIVVGVHTNMCVLGRPFGIRNLVQAGKNVVLMRDMTDTMYNPASRPYVSHFRGTDLVVQHIEKYWCPTITSTVFTGEAAFRFQNDKRPTIALVIAEPLYNTAETLPRYAAEVLRDDSGYDVLTVLPDAKDPTRFAHFERVKAADLVVLSVRRRALAPEEMTILREHLAAGKPLVAIRTSSHAFDAKDKGAAGLVEWKGFDAEVLGGNYHNHHKDGVAVKVTAVDPGEHPILKGVSVPFEAKGSLYKTSPLASLAKALLVGTIPGEKPEPVAWTNIFGKSKVFYTSLGHPEDFRNSQFRRLLANAIEWALSKDGAPQVAREKRDNGGK